MNQRMEFVMRAQTTENFRALCREYGISPKVGYKWSRRFVQNGLGGLNEESRRPKTSPKGLSEEVVCRIVLFRERHPHWGAKKIHELYQRSHGEAPSQSSIKRVLEKCGLVKKRRTRPAVEAGRLNSGAKAAAPNEIWTIDFKGWWHDAKGRCDPLTIRDEFSRKALELRALENAKTETVKAAMEEVFKRHGLPRRIRSDNGAPFAASSALLGLSRLSAWWLALGIDLERSRPGCPQDNGAHERLHLDISRQLESAGYTERQAAFDLWRKEFNDERPHEALGMRFPSEVYRDSERKYEGAPEKLLYPGIESRRVKPNGMIHFEGKVYFFKHSLGGLGCGSGPRGRGTLGSPIRTARSRAPGNSHRGFPAHRATNKSGGSESRMRPCPAAGTRFAQAPLRVRWLGFASQARTLRCACAIPIFPLNTKKHQTT